MVAAGRMFDMPAVGRPCPRDSDGAGVGPPAAFNGSDEAGNFLDFLRK